VPKTQAELADGAGAAGVEPVHPPPGVNVFAHFGPAFKTTPADKPLPTGTVFWSWAGAGKWYKPHLWPHGVRTREDDVADRVAKAVKARLAIEAGNFDLRGKVDKLEPLPRPGEATGDAGLPPGVSVGE
jgi:hypothetical protein